MANTQTPRRALGSLIQVAGFGAVTAGMAMWSVALALVVGGLSLVLVGVFVEAGR